MLLVLTGKYMTSCGFSMILNPGGTAGKNSCIVCTGLPFEYDPFVILQSTRRELNFKMEIGSSEVCVCPAFNTCGLNPSKSFIESFFVKSIS